MYRLQGVLVAMCTPMTEDEELNEEMTRSEVNRFLAAGIDGLFVLGTNGEFYALSFEEKLRLLEVVLDENQGRVPVCAGTGCITTKETISLSLRAAELGVDALSVITPYFVRATQEDLYRHYRAIAEAVDVPIILYNIPKRTGTNIEPETAARLSELPGIIGIKDSSGDFDNTCRYIKETTEGFTVLCGNDSLILRTLQAGGAGAVSGLANLFPEKILQIHRAWQMGDMQTAEAVQKSIEPIRKMLKYGNPNSVVKRAVNLLGYPVGPARRPVDAADPELTSRLQQVLELVTGGRPKDDQG